MEIPGWNLLVNGLASLLIFINNTVGGNPGLAIIIFTVIVRLATLPLTLKSLQSSRNMQAVQPLVKAVQQKYKDDKQKQQQEVMRIYSEHGVNPMLGCLPMLLQLPIFFALYQALISLVTPQVHVDLPIAWVPAVSATGAIQAPFAQPFLWIPSLAGHDPIYIMPVLAVLAQLLQQRMSIPFGYSKTADPQQQTMNRMMTWMPVFFMVFYLNFAAGAVLYWTASSLFGAVQQYFITGFGSLAELPGLHWLPKKELPKITPKVLARLEEEEKKEARRQANEEPETPAPAAAAPSKYRSEQQPVPANVADNRPQPKGLWARMLEQAIAAQEAQQAARATQEAGATAGAAPVDDAPTRRLPADGVETVRINGSQPPAAPLPRKKRGKR